MIGKKQSIKEAKHTIRLVMIALVFVIGISLLFFIVSALTGTGVNKKEKKKNTPVETENNKIELYTSPTGSADKIPTVKEEEG